MNVKFGETSCMQLLLGGVLWENGIRRVHGCVYVHVCIYACICVCVHVCVRKTWRLLPVIFQNQGMPTKVMPRGVSTGESRKQAQSWSLFKVLVKKGFTGKSFSNKTTKKTRSGTFAESKEQWDVSRHWLVQKCLWANTTPFPRLTHMGGVLLRSQRTGWKHCISRPEDLSTPRHIAHHLYWDRPENTFGLNLCHSLSRWCF